VQVLAVARPVAAGQAITAADLTTVSAAEDPNVRLVTAAKEDEVVGRSAAVPLLPGTLLTPALVGESAFPPAGKVSASVALKPGQFPAGLSRGARVAVYVSATVAQNGNAVEPSSNASPTRLNATVLGVDPAGDGQGGTVVSLLLDAADSARLASAPAGGVVLMQTSASGS
jgi:hypothetical protein